MPEVGSPTKKADGATLGKGAVQCQPGACHRRANLSTTHRSGGRRTCRSVADAANVVAEFDKKGIQLVATRMTFCRTLRVLVLRPLPAAGRKRRLVRGKWNENWRQAFRQS